MQIAWLVLTGEYFIPQIAQIIRIRSAGGRRREQGLINDERLLMDIRLLMIDYSLYIFSGVHQATQVSDD